MTAEVNQANNKILEEGSSRLERYLNVKKISKLYKKKTYKYLDVVCFNEI